MWSEIKQDILTLSKFDKGREIFGADVHRYSFGALVSEDQLKSVEEKLNIKLPNELRAFYMELGNGVVGPFYGIAKLECIEGYKQCLPYPGVDYFKALAAEEYNFLENGYFQLSHDYIQGLITIIDEGGGHEICLVSCGENVGRVVYVSCDGFIQESDQALIDLYRAWLAENISAFEEIKLLIDSDKSMEEIDNIFCEKRKRSDARDLVVSLIGSEKPTYLFGSGNQKRYHGASQFPWYENQLQNYRKKIRRSWWKFWG